MRVLLPSEVQRISVCEPTPNAIDPTLSPRSLQKIGDRLRATYDVAQEPLPARLAELVELLARRERPKD